MPRKVRLVLSSMQVLGYEFLILFDQILVKRLIWSDFSERVRVFGSLKMLSSLVWLILWHKNPCRPHNAKLRLYTYKNPRFTNKYLVDNIPNEPESTCLDTKLMAPSIAATQHQQFNPTSIIRLHIVK